ncbi:MAG: hypothetical protein A2991_03900 [Candidatus Terrybacteria bacterium RIFCSPLOWO2_01_FULL_58_14]|uniref:GIY-YIG domain-containing protein n=1 Tax=Candidatus Terrybacteria bacterium RIFCSPLOWO2_01_FULL_58_14 TaxID=1802369 RepID=A0A1G2PYZ8_9BACT|nr:MAG: hypothetical protein A2991_03900 [Candidatus Terrybacteria bacterium RIFCSPLOWO2_01_FULL_58_14]
MAWYVYIAKTKNERYYTGITNNTERRIALHNGGEGSRMAREQGPFELVYVSAQFPNKSEARKREIQVKGWTKDKKKKLISGEWR